MSKQPPMMHSDPDESELVRELLQAAVDAPSSYDIEAGLAKHKSHIAAGTPVPEWAEELLNPGAMSAAGTKAGLSAVGGALGWVVVAAIGIGAAGWAVVQLAEDRQDVGRPGVASKPASEGVAVSPTPPGTVVSPEQTPVDGTAALDGQALDGQAANQADNQAAAHERNTKRGPAVTGRQRAAKHHRARAGVADARRKRGQTGSPTAAVPGRDGKPSAAGQDVIASILETSQERRSSERQQAMAEQASAAASEASAEPVQPVTEDAHERWRRGAMEQDEQGDDANALLVREMRMLKAAQAALGSNPSRALSLARQGEREFPGSTFSQERRHLLILALVELGRLDEAKGRAADYLDRYPRGPFSDRVRTALAGSR